MSLRMSASVLFVFLVVLSLAVSSVAESSTWGLCYLSSSLPSSPYGPWSVALQGTLTVGPYFFFNDSGTPPAAGGARWAQQVTAASLMRFQLNRDGTSSFATLGLATLGAQGSDNLFFNTTPYTDWNGLTFQVLTSSDRPYPQAHDWIVFPNDFATQQIALFYDLPTYQSPSEYHFDNQTDAVIIIQPDTAPSCSPVPMPPSLHSPALTYQFCYQAYAAASGSQPAWQVAIQGTFLTTANLITSAISGQTGLYILTVTGTRTQQANGNITTTPIVGQSWHNSGHGRNEFDDDPLLQLLAPHLVPNYGFVLYTAARFEYPHGGMLTVDYSAEVNVDPLQVSSSSVIEGQGPKPDWSGLAVSCNCSVMTCPLISTSSSAAVDTNLSTSCSAISLSTSPLTCKTTNVSSSSSPALPSSPSSTKPSTPPAASNTPTSTAATKAAGSILTKPTTPLPPLRHPRLHQQQSVRAQPRQRYSLE